MNILLLVLLGGCILMHFLMMRKGRHNVDRENVENKDKEENNHKHGGCCH